VADESEATNPAATAPPPIDPAIQGGPGQAPSEPAAATPLPTADAAPSSAIAPQEMPAAPVSSVTPPVAHDNLAVKVYHGIMGALGGTQDVSYSIDPATHKMVASTVPSGPGSQWKRIIAGVVQGTAAGLGAAPGPGQLERAAGAGLNAGMASGDKITDQKKAQAQQDFDNEQKAMVAKAQTQALTYQGAVQNFQLSRMQVQAHQEDIDRENSFVKLIQGGGDGSQDLGVAKSFADVIQMHKDMPGLMTQNAHGNVVQTAHVNSEGQFDGTRFALVTPEWKAAKLDHDATFYTLQPSTEVGKPAQIIKQTVKAGSMTNGDFTNAQTASSNEILKWQQDQHKEEHQDKIDASTVKKNLAESAQAYAAADKDHAEALKAKREAAAIPTVGDDMSDDEIVKGMLNATVDITKTASIRGNSRLAYIKAAKKADPNFNMMDYNAKLKTRMAFSGDGKQAQQIQSFNAFLGHALDYSSDVNALRNSNAPLMNKPMNWLKANVAGNPVVSSMVIKQEAVKEEFQAFLNNNRALLSQDKEAGEKMLNNDMSPAQQQAAMRQFVTTAAIRMSAVNHTWWNQFHTDAPEMLDEDGKAALAHFGVPESMVYHHPTGTAGPESARPQPAAPPPPPAGASAEVHDAQGKLTGHVVNNKYVPLGQ
jgi:hypothetical protein